MPLGVMTGASVLRSSLRCIHHVIGAQHALHLFGGSERSSSGRAQHFLKGGYQQELLQLPVPQQQHRAAPGWWDSMAAS